MQYEGHEMNGLGLNPSTTTKKYATNTNQFGNHEYQEPVYYSYQNAQNASHSLYESLMSSTADNLYLQDSSNQNENTQKVNNQYFPYNQNYQHYPMMQQYMPYVPYYAYQHEPQQKDMNYYSGYNYPQYTSNVVDNTTRRVDNAGNDISPLSPNFVSPSNKKMPVSMDGNNSMIKIPTIKTSLTKGLRLSDTERQELLMFLEKKRKLDDNGNLLVLNKTKKDGIWPDELKKSIELCICTIPKDETNKMRLNMKQYGRNELISMYIQVHQGEHRKIKQVSSHIQVWKKRLMKDICLLTKIMKWKSIDSTEGSAEVQFNKKDIMNMEVYINKNELDTNEDIVEFNKMMKLTYNLLEYGMYRDTDAVFRYEELFSEVGKQIKAGLIQG